MGNSENVCRKRASTAGSYEQELSFEKKKKSTSCMDVFLNGEWMQQKRPYGGQVTGALLISAEGPPLTLFRHYCVCVLVRA